MDEFKNFYEKWDEVDNNKAYHGEKITEKRTDLIAGVIKKNGLTSVCDVGYGYGYYSAFFSSLGIEADGYDISKKNIAVAKKINCLEPSHSPGYYINDFSNNPSKKKYQLAFAFDVIEHIYDYDIFVKNIYNSLKEGGFIVLTTPNLLAPKRRLRILFGVEHGLVSKAHIHFFDPLSLRQVLTRNGFEVLKLTGTGKLSWLTPSLSGNLVILGRKK